MPPIELYTGSKNYWRLRTNVDFHMLEHVDEDVVEVICFHPVLHLEAPRIFLSISKYTQSLEPSKLEEMLTAKREELSRKRSRLPANELMHAVIRESIVQFILTRAQVVLDTAEQSFTLLMVPLAGDTVDDNQQLVQVVTQPAALQSHIVQRGGRLRSSKDFSDSMHALRVDARMLCQASSRAEKIVNLQNMAVEGFKGLMDVSKIYSDDMSPARRRFVRAVRRVMAQNAVAYYTKRLDEIERAAEERAKQELKVNKLGMLAPICVNRKQSTSQQIQRRQSMLQPTAQPNMNRRASARSFGGTSSAPIAIAAARAAAAATATATSSGSFAGSSSASSLPNISSKIALASDANDTVGELKTQQSIVDFKRGKIRSSTKSLTAIPEKSTWHHDDVATSVPAVGASNKYVSPAPASLFKREAVANPVEQLPPV